ncbi:MAG: transcriptional regulator PadR family protein [Geminicoccaceae bacterium]|jgi:DNA-binding PadR family transcriptional regulator|nr:transcriptional regulator PadR family protein [Geminicoccaceae bacterium]
MSRNALGEFEHHVLLALVRLGGRSRGAAVVLELESTTGRSVSPAAVFVALRRLEQRGFARSTKREARPGEGGRGSREFQITAAGTAKLAESRRTFERLWGARPATEPS